MAKRTSVKTWHGWSKRRFAAMWLLAIGAIAVCWEAWADIFTIAINDEESSHILLMPVVVAWLIYVRRQRFRDCRPTREWLGPAIVAFGWVLSWIGYSQGYQSLWHGGSVLILIGCIFTALGTQVMMRFLPAVVAMGFFVPVPGRIRTNVAIPLQEATAKVTQGVLETMNMNVARSGNVLLLNDLPIQIAENCNGIRMVFALLMVSYAFAFGTPLKGYVRLLIIGLSPISAVLWNVIRLAPTVTIYAYGDRAFADAFHMVGGWLMLLLAFLMLVLIIQILRWAMVPVTRYTLAYD